MILNDYDLNKHVLNNYRIYILSKNNVRSLTVLNVIIKHFYLSVCFLEIIDYLFDSVIISKRKYAFILEIDIKFSHDINNIIKFFLNYSDLSSILIIIYKKPIININKIFLYKKKCMIILFNKLTLFTCQRWITRYIMFNNCNIHNNKINFLSLIYFKQEEKLLYSLKILHLYKNRLEIKDFILTNGYKLKNTINDLSFNNKLSLLYFYKKLKKLHTKNISIFSRRTNNIILNKTDMIKLDIFIKNKKFDIFFTYLFKCISKYILKEKVIKYDKYNFKLVISK